LHRRRILPGGGVGGNRLERGEQVGDVHRHQKSVTIL